MSEDLERLIREKARLEAELVREIDARIKANAEVIGAAAGLCRPCIDCLKAGNKVGPTNVPGCVCRIPVERPPGNVPACGCVDALPWACPHHPYATLPLAGLPEGTALWCLHAACWRKGAAGRCRR